MTTRTPLVLLALGLAVLAGGCDGEWPLTSITGIGSRGARLDRTYDATWVYTATVPSLRRYESGACYSDLEIDQGPGDRFSGSYTIPRGESCIPPRSGTLVGRVDGDGDFRIQLRLSDGRLGVFEDFPNCIRVREDDAILGELWDGYLRGNAMAIYTCNMLGFGWTDIHIRITLNAEPIR